VQHGVVKIDEIARLSELAAPLQDIYERATPEFGGSLNALDPGREAQTRHSPA
jgi:hypothetical protein